MSTLDSAEASQGHDASRQSGLELIVREQHNGQGGQTPKSAQVDDEFQAFVDPLDQWVSLVTRDDQDNDVYRRYRIMEEGEEEEETPMTPVSLEFEQVLQAFAQYIWSIKECRSSECENPRCRQVRDTLRKILYALRDILRRKREQWWRAAVSGRRDVEQDKEGFPNDEKDKNKKLERDIMEMLESGCGDLRELFADLSDELILKEERQKGLHEEVARLNKIISSVPPDVLRRVTRPSDSDSVQGGLWMDRPYPHAPMIDRGTQSEAIPWLGRDEGRDTGRSPSQDLVDSPPPWVAARNDELSDDARTSAAGTEDDAMSENRRQILEDEGVVFHLPSAEVDHSALEGIDAFLTEDEGEAEREGGYDEVESRGAAETWAERDALVADLEDSNARLRQDMQELRNERAGILGQVDHLVQEVNKRQDFIDRLAADGAYLPEQGDAGDADLQVWGIDPLTVFLAAHMAAWLNIGLFFVSGALKLICVALALFGTGLQICTGGLVRRRIGSMDRIIGVLSSVRWAKTPSPRDVACVVKQLTVVLSMRSFWKLRQAKLVWLRANGMTKKYIMAHPSVQPPWWREPDPYQGQTCGRRIDLEELALFLVQFSDVWIEYILVSFAAAANAAAAVRGTAWGYLRCAESIFKDG